MPDRVLLCGPPQVGKSHLAHHLCAEKGFWFLNLDPASQRVSPLACAGLFAPGFVPHGFRFIGSLRITGDSLSSCLALCWALQEVGSAPFVCEVSVHHLSVIEVNVLRRLVCLLSPTEIWSIEFPNAEEVLQPLDACRLIHQPRDPESVPRSEKAQAKWRKAVWKTYFENAERVTLPMSRLRWMGLRLGSGVPLLGENLRVMQDLGVPNPFYAERVGVTLYLVCEGTPPGAAVAAVMDHFGCKEAHLVGPDAFRGLLACQVDSAGRHTLLVRLVEMMFKDQAVQLDVPSPVCGDVIRLQVGRLRIAEDGTELGELRPWQV